MDELLDVVNEQDEVIDQVFRSDIARCKFYFRVINCFLVNDKKELWIPIRSAHKKMFPLSMDMSVGGYVRAGETYEQAFERELNEELNMNLRDCQWTAVAKLSPVQDNVSSHMIIYHIKTNEFPLYNKNDFYSAEWLSIAQIKERFNNNFPAKSDLPVLIPILERYILNK